MTGVQTCALPDRKSTRLNSSHTIISYAVFCLKKKQTDRSRPDPLPFHPRSGASLGRGACAAVGHPVERCGVGVCLIGGARDSSFFFFNDTATTEIYTLSLHDALPI